MYKKTRFSRRTAAIHIFLRPSCCDSPQRNNAKSHTSSSSPVSTLDPWMKWGSITAQGFSGNADEQWPYAGKKRGLCRQAGEKRSGRGESFRRWDILGPWALVRKLAPLLHFTGCVLSWRLFRWKQSRTVVCVTHTRKCKKK